MPCALYRLTISGDGLRLLRSLPAALEQSLVLHFLIIYIHCNDPPPPPPSISPCRKAKQSSGQPPPSRPQKPSKTTLPAGGALKSPRPDRISAASCAATPTKKHRPLTQLAHRPHKLITKSHQSNKSTKKQPVLPAATSTQMPGDAITTLLAKVHRCYNSLASLEYVFLCIQRCGRRQGL